jgi:sugar lactone lactonase YvrE
MASNVVAVLPAQNGELHWVYYDDGRVVLFHPEKGQVRSEARVPESTPRRATSGGIADAAF